MFICTDAKQCIKGSIHKIRVNIFLVVSQCSILLQTMHLHVCLNTWFESCFSLWKSRSMETEKRAGHVLHTSLHPNIIYSFLTYEMPLKSRKCEFSLLLVTHYKSLTMSLLSERVQVRINVIKIMKIVHPTVSVLKALSQWCIVRVVSMNISIFRYSVAALVLIYLCLSTCNSEVIFFWIYLQITCIYMGNIAQINVVYLP